MFKVLSLIIQIKSFRQTYLILGGVSEDIDVNVFGDLCNLDIETYQWSVRNISNPNDLTLKGHNVTLVDNYMIVAFGIYDNNDRPKFSSSIYMLDFQEIKFQEIKFQEIKFQEIKFQVIQTFL
ncbi:hypothetical protein C2G38_2184714 [Gigaspora rosea]|uniref:Galactose oxidase n=1 Tax=Gigaspora rosea TaxID=44941 RepID=A0A397V7E9_9GLOM|nr:hypothetical protein C2G38_2184714 [Gigaspora rosea]